MRKLFFILALCAAIGIFAQSNNTASLCGKTTDKTTGEAIPFAAITLVNQDSVPIANSSSDLNGDFCFTNIAPGRYGIKAVCIGFQKYELTNIEVKAGLKTSVKVTFNSQSVTLSEVFVYTGGTRSCDLKSLSYCKISSVSAGVFSSRRTKKIKAVKPSFNTEEYNRINDNEFKDVSNEPLSTMSIDVDKASYSNIRRYISKGTLPPADAVRVEEMINYFHYNYPQPKGNIPFSISTEYTECYWNKKHNLVHIGIQGRTVKADSMPPNNLVFLIDVSGSMMEENKLPLVKSGLHLLVEQLRPQDKVSMVVYAGAAGIVLKSTSGADKNKINEAIDQLEAGGSTAGGEGIVLAYKMAKENFISHGNNRVILATDGDFNVGVSSDKGLVSLIEEKREDGIFLTVLGFGTGNYKDSKMEQLADKGNGNYAYIDDIFEAKKVLIKEMGGTLLTIAKDVKIQIEFNPAHVKAYRLVGYENRLLNKEDFNDDKKDAGELGAGHTVTAIYEIIPAGSEETISSVDPLKYQQISRAPISTSNEIMTVKFRYKEPKERKSKLIMEIVTDKKIDFSTASENCKFSCAVAEFGMLLRDSKFKGEANYANLISLAKQSKGSDEDGYRSEFVKLAEMAQLLKN